MSFVAVKGTRDFYPEQMRLRNHLAETWRRVSLRNGFEEYDAPIFEYLDLFTAKSGDEIASQLFHFTDRGGRNLAIRPEITPSLARMVNARVRSLPRPIKWFSIPRLCRAENPQRGRLREFFQWNIDVIGEDSPLADAECVLVAVDALRELGLTDNDVCVRYSSRQLVSAVLAELGLQEESQRAKVLAALDKRNKVPAEAFEKMLGDAFSQQGLLDTDLSHDRLMKFLEISDVERATAEQIAGEIGIECSEAIRAAVADLGEFRRHLAEFGIEGWCAYDAGIVRGLAYYTGIVYEVFDRSAALRAVAGGGRYANLLEVLGGPAVSATGFGMGDVVLSILLEEKGLLGEELTGGELDLFLIDADEADLPAVLGLAAELRRCGLRCDYSFRRQAIGKQLKEASRRGSRGVVILEPGGGEVSVKNLATGEQAKEPTEAFRQRASQIARAEDLLP